MEIGLEMVRRQTEEGGPDRRLVFQAAFLLINSVVCTVWKITLIIPHLLE
jgi:hypothetical protein